MKRSLLSCLLLGAAAATPLPLPAAESPTLKVTSVLHSDGTRTDTTINLEENTSEEKKVDAKGKQISRIVSELDENKLPKAGTYYDAKDQPIYRFTYARDPFGRIAEERKFTVQGALAQRLIYHYNPQGRLTKIEAFDANGNRIP